MRFRTSKIQGPADKTSLLYNAALPGMAGALNVRIILLLLLTLSALPRAGAAADIAEQRQQYREALAALRAQRNDEFAKLAAGLRDYPLYPYLEYHDLRRRIYQLPEKELAEFFAKWPDTPLLASLRDSWLLALAQQESWDRYLQVWRPEVRSTELHCYHLRALLHKGARAEALEGVRRIWSTPRSLPKACDPLLKTWQDAGLLEDDLVWERLAMALGANEVSLADYLVTRLSDQNRGLGSLFVQTHRHPENLAHGDRYAGDGERLRQVILHGVRRLSRRDPNRALPAWLDYRSAKQFAETERRETDRRLAIDLASGYRDGAREQMERADPNYLDPDVQAWRLRYALRANDWSTVLHAARQLGSLDPESTDWPYWEARALLVLHRAGPALAQARELLEKISVRRQFYGFLAAERLGRPHAFEHERSTVTPLQIDAMERQPGIRRALELFILGHESEARLEWDTVVRELDGPRLLAAAHVAQDWAWHDRAVQVTIEGRLWNHLHLRFPTGWREEFFRNARLNNLDRWWPFAIARQESAYRPDARSSADATGLMQLLPSTAQRVARQIGARYRKRTDLEKPTLNIRLGSAFLGQMLRRYDGVLAHATAAYNAGPARVDDWLAAAPDLPLDAWIETIPFGETRGYVKNVLSFRLIYAYLAGRNLENVLGTDGGDRLALTSAPLQP